MSVATFLCDVSLEVDSILRELQFIMTEVGIAIIGLVTDFAEFVAVPDDDCGCIENCPVIKHRGPPGEGSTSFVGDDGELTRGAPVVHPEPTRNEEYLDWIRVDQ